MAEPRLRDAVRAVIVDPDERILLVQFEFPNWVGWATPGGGVVPGESDEEALRRELAEETGLGRFELGPLVWRRTHLFALGEWDGQVERYYLVSTPAFAPAPQLSWEQLNAEYVTAIRWWTLAELEAADVQFAPRRLRDLVRDLFAELPSEPVDVDV